MTSVVCVYVDILRICRGLDTLREYPELLPACEYLAVIAHTRKSHSCGDEPHLSSRSVSLQPTGVWASVHVCMDILLYLVKYNFR